MTDWLDVLLDNIGADRLTRVVDVGANPIDRPPYQTLLERSGCTLWGFEPQKKAYEALQSSKSEREFYFPYAVGDGTRKTLHLYRDSGLVSTFEASEAALGFLGRSRANIKLKDKFEVETVRLDDIEEIDRFDLLKIDIQGGEVAVFEGAAEKLSRAVAVVTEVRFYPLYEGEPMLGGVDEALRGLGFQFHKFLFTKSKVLPSRQIDRLKRANHRNQLIDGDAVYLRDLGRPDEISSEDLKHLAVLAASVFESHDLVLHCLDHLVARGAVSPDLSAAYVEALPEELKKSA